MHSGMDVVRLNFSHGNLAEHLSRVRLIRQLNKKYRRHVRILGDLEGYRIRIGKLEKGGPVETKKNQTLWLTTKPILGTGSRIPFDYKGPLSVIRRGQPIYIDDGKIALEVVGHDSAALKVRVVVPGAIKERKGINMPGVQLPFKGVTAHDAEDIRFCLEHSLDFIAQSFVRSKDDILDLRAHLRHHPHPIGVIAKIESREGIDNIDEIIGVCEGIMIARGDMGVSIPIWEVPMVQKNIIRKCNRAGKFVITATQMLESMTENRIPTRAEASDVANAILDGTDYVMLSAESAVGVHPAECVHVMNEIIKYTERHG